MDSILILDDEPNIRTWLQVALEKKGRLLFSAGSYEEAAGIFKCMKIDLLIADIILDRKSGNAKSGIDAIMDLRVSCPEAKAIAISGGGGIVERSGILLNCAKNFGADMILEKPFESNDIIEAAKRLLDEEK
jgi:DNA-binding NtrC family response regulator